MADTAELSNTAEAESLSLETYDHKECSRDLRADRDTEHINGKKSVDAESLEQSDGGTKESSKPNEEPQHEAGFKLITICASLSLVLFCTALDNTNKCCGCPKSLVLMCIQPSHCNSHTSNHRPISLHR